MGCIYRAYVPASGKFYIGQSRHETWKACYVKRWHGPVSRKRKGKILNLWERAMLKYGKKGIQFRTLMANVSPEDIDAMERFFIAKYRSNEKEFGYNLEGGGSGNKKMAESTRQRMRDRAAKCRWFHKDHGQVCESISQVARRAGIAPSGFCLLRRGRLRSHRGWVSLDAPQRNTRTGRAARWEHSVLGSFVGETRELVKAFSQERLNRSSLAKVRNGSLSNTSGWRFVRAATCAEEMVSRIAWANSPWADAYRKRGISPKRT